MHLQSGFFAILLLIFAAVPCSAQIDIAKLLESVEKKHTEAMAEKDAKDKDVKLQELIKLTSDAIESIKKSNKVFTDEELEPFYKYRGLAFFETRNYVSASVDLTIATKLNPKKLNQKIFLSLIQSSAPDGKLRDGKASLELAEKAMKEIKAEYAAAQAQKNKPGALLDMLALTVLASECNLALGAAHAELGNFKEAISVLNADKAKYKDIIEQFRDSKPYRLPEREKDK